MIKTLGLSLLEKTINRYVALDPETQEKLQALDGNIICLNIKGLPIDCPLFLHITRQGFVVSMPDHDPPIPHATISATPLSLLRLGLLPNDHHLFGKNVKIEGDLNIGTKIKHILDNMEIDWEEHLSNIVGDIAAERIGHVARKTKREVKRAIQTTGENLSEYLQTEMNITPSRIEIDLFCKQVDDLRNAVARFEQRLARFKKGSSL